MRRAARGRGQRGWGLAALLVVGLLATPARAAGPAKELAGLFIQGCLNFAGNPAGLRAWAHRQHLPMVPQPARAVFLHGAPGTAFDASEPGEKLVLVSADDGICSAITNHAAGAPAAAALEQDLHRLNIRFRLVINHEDPDAAALHYREYLAARGKRAWRVLVASVKGKQNGQVMLTAAPE